MTELEQIQAQIVTVVCATITKERERCANIAFDVGYKLAEYDGFTPTDLVIKAAEEIAAAIRRGD